MTYETRFVCDICGRDINGDKTTIQITEQAPARPRIAPSRYDVNEYHFHSSCAAPVLAYIDKRLPPETARKLAW